MTDEVYECCKRILESRSKPQSEPMVDGYTGFLFLDKNGMPTVALHWEYYFSRAVGKYNKIYRFQLPKITPHVCRHTYCSNMARSGMTPRPSWSGWNRPELPKAIVSSKHKQTGPTTAFAVVGLFS